MRFLTNLVREMSLLKLRFSMIGTVAVIIAASTLAFSVITTLMGTFNLLTLGLLVVGFNLIQWLFAPRLIDALYKVREVSKAEETAPKAEEIRA